MLPDAMDERAKIVAWMRSESDDAELLVAPWVTIVRRFADQIERGDHDYIDLPRIKLGKVGD